MSKAVRDGTIAVADQPGEVAIPALFGLHGSKLYSLGLRICGSPQEAEDLVQETFLRAFRKWDQFQGRSSPKTWLYTIATRACCRLRRKRAGEPKRLESLSELLPSGQKKIPDIPSPAAKPDEVALRGELKSALEAAIPKLPLRFRLPLVLKDLAEFPVRDVARILGVKEATVKTRLHRARLFLRKELSAGLPHRATGPTDHSRRICLDLLKAKLEAMDRGVDFPLLDEQLCSRCRSVLSTLELTYNLCREIAKEPLPRQLQREMHEALAAKCREASALREASHPSES